MNVDKGTLYFVTGLSGAGKTTIGSLFYRELKKINPALVLLDGDIIRKTYNEDIGYTADERKKAAFRTERLCKLLTEQGISVVLCAIAMFDEIRSLHRRDIENYCEIYLRVTRETLVRRNQKGLYTGGTNVVGVDVAVEEPKNPDVMIDNNGERSPAEICHFLMEHFSLN